MTGEATDQGRLDLGGDIADDASSTEKLPVEASGGVDDAVPQGLPGRVVRVLPDVAAVGRAFDYLVPPAWENDGRAENLGVGSRVRRASRSAHLALARRPPRAAWLATHDS